MKSEKEIVLAYVEELKLMGIKDELEDVCSVSLQEGWSHMRLIAELLRKETQRRAELRVRTRHEGRQVPADEVPP